MRFAKQTSEENERYNHFQATADTLSFREWRALNQWRDGNGGTPPVITTVKVRVGGTGEEVVASLEVAGKERSCAKTILPRPPLRDDKLPACLYGSVVYLVSDFLHSVKHYNNENLCEQTQHCQALNINSENTVTNSESVRNQEQRGQA